MSKARMANNAWEAMMTAHVTMMRSFAADDIWTDVSMREYDVLYSLSKQAHPMSMSELNRHVLLSQPALSRLVDRLVERDLVQRSTDDDDGRAVRLTLTAEGSRRQRRTGTAHARCVRRGMTSLTAEELRLIETLCRKLTGGTPDV